MRLSVWVLLMLGFAAVSPKAFAQSPAGYAEVALTYTWMHSNAPPGGCGCFSLQGGSATAALPLGPSPISAVADVTVVTGSSGTPGFYGSLRLTTITAGVRYTPWLRSDHPWRPYAQAQVGLAHAGGSLAGAPFPSAANASATFAASAGGGLDLRINRHAALRFIDAEYVLTTFDNNSNNRQNNIRLSGGFVLRF